MGDAGMTPPRRAGFPAKAAGARHIKEKRAFSFHSEASIGGGLTQTYVSFWCGGCQTSLKTSVFHMRNTVHFPWLSKVTVHRLAKVPSSV